RLLHSTHKKRSPSAPSSLGLFHSTSLLFPSGRNKIVLSPSSLSSYLELIHDSISDGPCIQSGGRVEGSPSPLMLPSHELFQLFLPPAPLEHLTIFNVELSFAVDRY
ncbi:hypothetical protein PFISCL1PPCAC_25786, partial [Pristionchus fissidentatus]